MRSGILLKAKVLLRSLPQAWCERLNRAKPSLPKNRFKSTSVTVLRKRVRVGSIIQHQFLPHLKRRAWVMSEWMLAFVMDARVRSRLRLFEFSHSAT